MQVGAPCAKLDILHPRAKLEWSEINLFPDDWEDRIDPNMAILKENVYMQILSGSDSDNTTLWRYGEWFRSQPNVPVSEFGLTRHSGSPTLTAEECVRLTLIGGSVSCQLVPSSLDHNLLVTIPVASSRPPTKTSQERKEAV